MGNAFRRFVWVGWPGPVPCGEKSWKSLSSRLSQAVRRSLRKVYRDKSEAERGIPRFGPVIREKTRPRPFRDEARFVFGGDYPPSTRSPWRTASEGLCLGAGQEFERFLRRLQQRVRIDVMLGQYGIQRLVHFPLGNLLINARVVAGTGQFGHRVIPSLATT